MGERNIKDLYRGTKRNASLIIIMLYYKRFRIVFISFN